MTYVDASENATHNDGRIKLHSPEDFEGMRQAGKIAAETLDFISPCVVLRSKVTNKVKPINQYSKL